LRGAGGRDHGRIVGARVRRRAHHPGPIALLAAAQRATSPFLGAIEVSQAFAQASPLTFSITLNCFICNNLQCEFGVKTYRFACICGILKVRTGFSIL
jgi:hypothetical protein